MEEKGATSGPKKIGQNLKKEPAQKPAVEIISAFINKLEFLLAKYEKNEKEDNQARCQPVGKKTTTKNPSTEPFTKRKSRAEIKKEKEKAPRENIKKVWKLKFAESKLKSLS